MSREKEVYWDTTLSHKNLHVTNAQANNRLNVTYLNKLFDKIMISKSQKNFDKIVKNRCKNYPVTYAYHQTITFMYFINICIPYPFWAENYTQWKIPYIHYLNTSHVKFSHNGLNLAQLLSHSFLLRYSDMHENYIPMSKKNPFIQWQRSFWMKLHYLYLVWYRSQLLYRRANIKNWAWNILLYLWAPS